MKMPFKIKNKHKNCAEDIKIANKHIKNILT